MENKVETQNITVLKMNISDEIIESVHVAYTKIVADIVKSIKENDVSKGKENRKYPESLETMMVSNLMKSTIKLIETEANMLSQFITLSEVIEAMADVAEEEEKSNEPDPQTTH